MSISTNRKHVIRLYIHLNHRRFGINNIPNGRYNLKNVFPCNFLAILETLNHIFNKLLSHLFF